MRASPFQNPPLLAALLLKPFFFPFRPSSSSSSSSLSLPGKTLAMAKTLDESHVGISCYVSSLPGFRGVLKQRYADFIVNEVDGDGKIVRLTTVDLPPNVDDDKEEEKSPSIDKDYSSEIESFRSLCGDADAEALKELLGRISSSPESDVLPIILSPDSDKSHRADVHNFFKKNFNFLVTDTVEGSDGNERCIRVRFSLKEAGGGSRRGKKRKNTGHSDSNDGRPFDSRGSDSWPEHLGKFLRFHLYKENKDTQEALGVIGKMLGIQQRSFGFAGTKDKRSISTQRATIFKLHANRLAALNSRLFGIKVGDFSGVVADSEETVKTAADGLGKNGFINYYGLQRFGSGSVPTHLVGAALLRGEWKDAAREFYKEHGNIDATLRKLPRHLVAERAVLQCLKKCPGNYLQALKAIPRTLRMMYVHSYQSYLWNHAVSMRVQKYGVSQVALGDLVYCKDSSPVDMVKVDSSETEDDLNDGSLLEESGEEIPDEKVQFVKTVDSEDLQKGTYTFEDVVLPLPGSRIIYPGNEDGISLIESAHGVKELRTYTDDNISLAETDLDIMSKSTPSDLTRKELLTNGDSAKKLASQKSKGEIDMELSKVDSISNSDALLPKMALKMEFTLPASCYATMAIRELQKSCFPQNAEPLYWVVSFVSLCISTKSGILLPGKSKLEEL
ncbi:Multisubstrate pseudouridine synthase 7 [Ananas comosus]|uniref:Multisubstrate pseudouridine synthase 7 n=1 Tax=Ananas comosus TaxID=4615 RepID=A0A199VQH2_ANACO|nr:Multisubstrate pseudouridine synthase 7 [Ananas comosus]